MDALYMKSENQVMFQMLLACNSHQPYPIQPIEQLKDDDMDFIVNNDELTQNYEASDLSPVPAQSRKKSPYPAGEENIYEGDLGLGGYELQSEPVPGQSQLTSSA
ncbi:Sodium/hydrogen exchanger 9 [Varanus komodoensis]|nr:Sodium/hydrogen exchanger 9 [Varanus komodoensis]